MSLDLSQIRFKVETEELELAVKKIEKLGESVQGLAASIGKLDKEASDANKTQSQTNLNNAKTEALNIKNAKALRDTAAATEELTDATKKRQSVEERQAAITRLMSDGYSRGQASILATAEAAGEATVRLGELLKTQRAMSGANAFDKSIGAATVFANELKVATIASDLYNKDLGFTKNQLQELGREHVRLTEQFKAKGKDVAGVDAEFQKIVQSAQEVTQAENAMAASMKNGQKATMDAGKANAYIENELQKVRFALQANNEELNRGTANSLVRFENALKKSGLTLDQQKVKIDEYRKAQVELQKTTSSNQTDYITRAVGPQITDIIVGLSTGQSPLTVMMQQGGQLRDQFGMMGIAAKDMGDVMRNAMSGMARSVLDTGKAIGGMLVGGVIDAGKAVTNFVSDITGLNKKFDEAKRAFAAMGEEGFTHIGMMNRLGSVISGLVAVGLVALIASFVALGVALKEVITQESELSKAMNLSAGSLGLTTQGAQDLAKAYGSAKGNVGAFSDAIAESAKAGSITQQNLYAVTSAAIELEKVTGIKVSETVKSFSKLADEPSKALVQLAKDTGLIEPEIVAVVIALEDQGKKAEAAAIATRAYSDALKDASGNIRNEMGYLQTFFSTIGSAASDMWNRILNVGRKGSLTDELSKAQSELTARVNEGASWYQMDAAYKEELVNLGLIVNSVQARIDKEKELGDKKVENAKQSGLEADSAKLLDTYGAKKNKREEEINKAKKVYGELIAAAGDDQARVNSLLAKEAEVVRGINDKYKEKVEKKAQLTQEQKDIIKGLEERVDLENKVLGLNKDYNNQMYRANLLFESGNSSQEQRQKSFDDIEKAQPRYTASLAAQKKLTEDMKKDNESILKLKEDSAKFLTDETIKTQKTTSEYNLRLSLLGKTEEQQKKITQESELQNKLAESNNEFEKQRTKLLDDYEKAKRTANGDTLKLEYDLNDALIALDVARADKQRVINQETAIKAAEEFQKAFDAIKSSITDVITTALFDGGKAGSKKLRDQVVAAFRNKITVVIDAVVNTALSGGMNALGLGATAAGGASGGLGGLMSGVSSVSGMATIGQGIANILPASFSSALGLTSSALQSSNAALLGGGASANAAAQAAGAAGNASALSSMASTAGSILSYASALNSLSEGKIGAAAGTALGQYFGGPLGAFIGGKIGAALDEAFAGETRSGASYTSSGGKSVFEKGPSGGEIAGKEARILMENAMSAITDTLKAVGSKATLTGFVAGLESSDNNKGFNYAGGQINGKSFGESLGRDGGQFAMVSQDAKTAFANYGKELSQSILEALQVTEDIPKSLKAMVEGIDIEALTTEETDALLKTVNTLVQTVTGFNTAMLSLPFEYLKDLSFDTAAGLIAAAGGLESLVTNLSGFYDNFYTEAEKTANLTKNTSDAFAAMNIEMPKIDENTRKWYRSEVERLGAMDLSVESNAKAYASVLGLQGAVNTLAPAFDSVGTSVSDLAESARQAAATMVSSWASIMQARGVSSSEVTRFTAQADINSAFTQYKTTDKFGIKSAEQFQTITQDDFKNYTAEQQKLISTILVGFRSLTDANAETVKDVTAVNNSYTPYVEAIKEVQPEVDKAIQATADYQMAIWEATGDTASAATRQRELATATKLAAGWTQSQIDNLYGAQEAAVVLQKQKEQTTLATQATADYQLAIWEATGDTASAAIRQRELATATKLAAGWTQSQIDNLYGAQEAAEAKAKSDAGIKAADEQRASNSSALLSILADTAALTNDVVLAESMLNLQRVKQLIELRKADPSGELANATFNLWKLQDAAKATADLKAKEEARTKVQSDFGRALLDAAGNSSGLAEFDRRISDAALIVAGWTEAQVQAVNATRADTEAKTKADADLKAQVQIQSDYTRALLEASGDSSGLAAFDRKLSDAALVASGWTQVQIDAVNTTRASTEAKAKADALVQVQSDYNRALLEASGDTSGLAEFDRKLSDAALIAAGWTQTQVDAIGTARASTEAKAKADALVQIQSDYSRALLEASGDTSGLAAFDRKLSDAALITSGWTASMVLAVNEARSKAEADLKLKEQAQVQSDYNRALLEASNDSSGLAAFDRKLSDAALVAAGWTETQVQAVNAARLKTEADNKAQEALKAWGATMQSLADIKSNLQVDLMTAQGRTGDADALRRQLDLAPMTLGTSGTESSAITDAYDFNNELRKQIATANANKDLSNQLSILLGTQTERTIALGSATDATTKALMKQVWAQQDAKAQADERAGLTNQLLQIQGKTSELRNREILGINASNRALQRRIWALQDEAQAQSIFDAASSAITQNYITANQELAQAQSAITELTNQSADSMRGFSESIRDFLKSLETTALGSSSPESRYRALQTEFGTVSRAAATGDVNALGKLTGVASDFLTSSKDYFATGTGFIMDESMVKRILGEIQLSTGRAGAAALQEQDPAAKAQLDLARAMASVANANEMIRVTGVTTSVATTDLLADFRKAQENLLLAQEEAKMWKEADDLLQLNQTTAVTDTALAITEVLNPTTANIDIGVTTLNSTLTVSNNYLAAIQMSSESNSKNSKDAYVVLEALNVQLIELNAKNAFLNSEVSSLRSKVTSMESNQRLSASAPPPVQ